MARGLMMRVAYYLCDQCPDEYCMHAPSDLRIDERDPRRLVCRNCWEDQVCEAAGREWENLETFVSEEERLSAVIVNRVAALERYTTKRDERASDLEWGSSFKKLRHNSIRREARRELVREIAGRLQDELEGPWLRLHPAGRRMVADWIMSEYLTPEGDKS